MKKAVVILALIASSALSLGAGFYMGGSNIGFGGYPKFSKNKPYPPYNHDKWAGQEYNHQVEEYVREAEQYIENAKNDIEQIQMAIREAIDEANSVVTEFNYWARN